MGLIKEVFTELIDLPESATTSFDLERDLLILNYKANYAILNLLFQILDCLIIPYFTLALLSKNLDFIKIIIVLVLGFLRCFQYFNQCISYLNLQINIFHFTINYWAKQL